MHELEDKVARHYASVRLSEEFRSKLRRQLDDVLLDELGSLDALRKRLALRPEQLDAKEEQYLDLVGEPGWPREKLRQRLDTIAAERATISDQLASTASKLETGREEHKGCPLPEERASFDHLTGADLLTVALGANGSSRAALVEVLTAYSHSTQAADLRICHTVVLTSPVRAARPSTQRPWSLRERLDEREIAKLITAYRNGATAASLATTHGVSPSSIKRLLRTVRRAPSTRGPEATPTTTYP